jgi:hypothetical protein
MEQNVAAPEDSIPNDDKTPTEETGDAVRGEEKSLNDPVDEPNSAKRDDSTICNTGDAVRRKEKINDEDNSASRLRSGKAIARSTSTCKQPPKLTVHEFYRRKAEAAEAERKKKTSKGGKSNAVVARGRKRAA